MSYTDLYADAEGTVTDKGAEPGEVVRAGQMIVKVARQGERDAVFDVPAQLIRTDRDPVVQIALTDDPSVRTTGRVREIAPEADPTTRTFKVKVGLTKPPEAMRLGATVTGTIQLGSAPVIEVPASALTEASGRPAVWVVDPTSQTVALRNIDVSRYEPNSVVVAQGLDARRDRGHGWRAGAAPEPEGAPARRVIMSGFNLSEWAIRHRSLVVFFMLVLAVAGVGSYLRLGRKRGSGLHDPDHGGAGQLARRHDPDTLQQVTERLERKLRRRPTSIICAATQRGPEHGLRQPERLDPG